MPQRSEPAPAKIEVMPQATEVIATRLAISGTLTDRSRAMSIRNGARVVPLAATVNIASEAASSRAHGMRSRSTNWRGVGRSVGRGAASADVVSPGRRHCGHATVFPWSWFDFQHRAAITV